MKRRYRVRKLQEQSEYSVGEKLAYLRTARGWSLPTLEDVSGVSAATASSIENNLNLPSLNTLSLLLKALEISPVEFFKDVKL